MSYFQIYFIIYKKLKVCNIIDTYETTFSEIEKIADGCLQIEHGVIINYFDFRYLVSRKQNQHNIPCL